MNDISNVDQNGMKIGGVLVCNPADFIRKKKTDAEILLISSPTKTLST